MATALVMLVDSLSIGQGRHRQGKARRPAAGGARRAGHRDDRRSRRGAEPRTREQPSSPLDPRPLRRPRTGALRREARRHSARDVVEVPARRRRVIRVVADTHALVWALANAPRLSPAARAAFVPTGSRGTTTPRFGAARRKCCPWARARFSEAEVRVCFGAAQPGRRLSHESAGPSCRPARSSHRSGPSHT
jgi:hypothetical protein